jgi:hypothetical protein
MYYIMLLRERGYISASVCAAAAVGRNSERAHQDESWGAKIVSTHFRNTTVGIRQMILDESRQHAHISDWLLIYTLPARPILFISASLSFFHR